MLILVLDSALQGAGFVSLDIAHQSSMLSPWLAEALPDWPIKYWSAGRENIGCLQMERCGT